MITMSMITRTIMITIYNIMIRIRMAIMTTVTIIIMMTKNNKHIITMATAARDDWPRDRDPGRPRLLNAQQLPHAAV